MLHACLSHGSRAALQFYPENDAQVELCMKAATKSGFGGGLVVDYPNSRKARKCFLVLWVGGVMRVPAGLASDEELALIEEQQGKQQQLPRGLLAEHENPDSVGQVKFDGRNTVKKGKKATKKAKAKEKGGKEWILKKKELYRKRGKDDVPLDSKYTARKRRTVF
jgi:18S rRNA (guanine1575-N7)-methyltransferase